MVRTYTKFPAFYLAIIAIAGWFALAAQFYLIIHNRVVSLTETITRYFSFFTILTNIIVACCVTILLLRPNSRCGRSFSQPATMTAITVYISMVGVVYNVILRFLWQPQGLQYVVDELLHSLIPVLFILLWYLYVPKADIKYKNVLSWLIYPFAYLIYTIIRGEISGYYPYPFIDVIQLGYRKMLINSLGLVIAFSGLSLFLVALGKFMSQNRMVR